MAAVPKGRRQVIEDLDQQVDRLASLEKLREQRQELSEQIDQLELDAGVGGEAATAALEQIPEGDAYLIGSLVVVGKRPGDQFFTVYEARNVEDRADQGKRMLRWMRRSGLVEAS